MIRVLREKWPQLTWTAHRVGFGSWLYEASNGWMGWWTASMDEDADPLWHRFYVYKSSTNEPPEQVFLS